MSHIKTSPLSAPIDTSRDVQSTGSETYGMPGFTVDNIPEDNLDQSLQSDRSRDDAQGVESLLDEDAIEKQAAIATSPAADEATVSLLDLVEGEDDTLTETADDGTIGEHDVSGSTAAPGSDDDTVLNAHRMGIGLDEDDEHPKPLNIAADVAATERSRRGR